jgi:hypothetical protein
MDLDDLMTISLNFPLFVVSQQPVEKGVEVNKGSSFDTNF